MQSIVLAICTVQLLRGGTSGNGTVYELSHTSSGWIESTLYSFGGGTDGGLPASGVVIDSAGNLYGTATNGGDPSCQCGVVFQLTRSAWGWNETVLYSFQYTDGGFPYAGLAWDSSGNLYGGTCSMSKSLRERSGLGGKAISQSGRLSGSGISTIFELTFAGGQWVYLPMHVFNDSTCIFGNLAVDMSGVVWELRQLQARTVPANSSIYWRGITVRSTISPAVPTVASRLPVHRSALLAMSTGQPPRVDPTMQG